MFVVILNNSYTFTVSREIKDEIAAAANKGMATYTFPTGEIIALRPFPSIILLDRALAAERYKLAKVGKKRSKQGHIYNVSDNVDLTVPKKIDLFNPMIDVKKIMQIAPPKISDKYKQLLSEVKVQTAPRASIEVTEGRMLDAG